MVPNIIASKIEKCIAAVNPEISSVIIILV